MVPQHLGTPAIFGSFKNCHTNCRPWQFYPHFFLWTQTADLGSFMVTASNCRPQQFVWQFSAPMQLWSQNCRPWQFVWHFSAPVQFQNLRLPIKLPTSAVCVAHSILVAQTADLGSLCGSFQHPRSFGHKTADLGSLCGSFQQGPKVSIKLLTLAVCMAQLFTRRLMLANCRPWQFYGHFLAMMKMKGKFNFPPLKICFDPPRYTYSKQRGNKIVMSQTKYATFPPPPFVTQSPLPKN